LIPSLPCVPIESSNEVPFFVTSCKTSDVVLRSSRPIALAPFLRRGIANRNRPPRMEPMP
jgi:hypothetical protein